MSSDDMKKIQEEFEELAHSFKDIPSPSKEGKSWNNEMIFCSSSTQPGIVWEPVNEGRHFECFNCGIKATSFCLCPDKDKDCINSKKIFACNTCMWKLPDTSVNN